METKVKVALGLLSAIGSFFWSVYVGTYLWAWFISPAFGIAALSFWSLFGVTLAFRYIFLVDIMEKLTKITDAVCVADRNTLDYHIKIWATPLVVFGIGYLAK